MSERRAARAERRPVPVARAQSASLPCSLLCSPLLTIINPSFAPLSDPLPPLLPSQPPAVKPWVDRIAAAPDLDALAPALDGFSWTFDKVRRSSGWCRRFFLIARARPRLAPRPRALIGSRGARLDAH